MTRVIDDLDRKIFNARQRSMSTSEFDSRTAASMEAALERVCRTLPPYQNDHATRRAIAQQLIDCARGGRVELDELTAAGVRAIDRLGLRRGA